jgi:hypothetical protein
VFHRNIFNFNKKSEKERKKEIRKKRRKEEKKEIISNISILVEIF